MCLICLCNLFRYADIDGTVSDDDCCIAILHLVIPWRDHHWVNLVEACAASSPSTLRQRVFQLHHFCQFDVPACCVYPVSMMVVCPKSRTGIPHTLAYDQASLALF